MAQLSLNNEEEEELPIQGRRSELEGLELCLVGRFLTDKMINFLDMKHYMARVWRAGMGTAIKELKPQLFPFRFYHILDLQRVLDTEPWSFNGNTLILYHLQSGENPLAVPLTHFPLWVQVYDIPAGFMSIGVGEQIGNYVGRFVEYDDSNNQLGLWRTYMRILVLIDVRIPLQMRKKIRMENGAWAII